MGTKTVNVPGTTGKVREKQEPPGVKRKVREDDSMRGGGGGM